MMIAPDPAILERELIRSRVTALVRPHVRDDVAADQVARLIGGDFELYPDRNGNPTFTGKQYRDPATVAAEHLGRPDFRHFLPESSPAPTAPAAPTDSRSSRIVAQLQTSAAPRPGVIGLVARR